MYDATSEIFSTCSPKDSKSTTGFTLPIKTCTCCHSQLQLDHKFQLPTSASISPTFPFLFIFIFLHLHDFRNKFDLKSTPPLIFILLLGVMLHIFDGYKLLWKIIEEEKQYILALIYPLIISRYRSDLNSLCKRRKLELCRRNSPLTFSGLTHESSIIKILEIKEIQGMKLLYLDKILTNLPQLLLFPK